MVDSCDVQPISKGDALSYFWHNFGRFYRGNRAPFGIHIHPDWLLRHDDYFTAFETFIDSLLTDMNDVYFVTASQVIAWMKDPQTVDQASHFAPWKSSCQPQGQGSDVAPKQVLLADDTSRDGDGAQLAKVLDDTGNDQSRQWPDDNESETAKIYSASVPTKDIVIEKSILSSFDGGDQVPASISHNYIISSDIVRQEKKLRANEPMKHSSSQIDGDSLAPHSRPKNVGRRIVGGSDDGISTLNAYKLAKLYVEPIGDLAEPTTETIIIDDRDKRRFPVTASTYGLNGRHMTDFIPADDTEYHLQSLAALNETATLSLNPVPSLFRRVVNNHIAMATGHEPLENDSGVAGRKSGQLKYGDTGQLKSGSVDDSTYLEEIIQREPVTLVEVDSSSSSSQFSSRPDAAGQEIIDQSTILADQTNLPVANMTAEAARVTSSTCVAFNTVTWVAISVSSSLLALILSCCY